MEHCEKYMGGDGKTFTYSAKCKAHAKISNDKNSSSENVKVKHCFYAI